MVDLYVGVATVSRRIKPTIAATANEFRTQHVAFLVCS